MDRRTPDRDALAEHAARQHGCFTRSQAIACGYSEYRIRAKRRSGEWTAVLRDVFVEHVLALTPRVRDVAAHLAMPGAVLVGPSAARWHEMGVASDETFVVVGTGRPRRRHVHVVHERLAPDEQCIVGGLRATTVERTVFDCLRLLPDHHAMPLLDAALRQGWTSLPRLADRVRAATNRHGTPRLVALMRRAAHGSHAGSVRLGAGLLQRAGIWGWRRDQSIADRWGLIGIGDIVFPDAMLVLDLGGRALDQGRLAAAGWTLVRYSWVDLTGRPDEVTVEIRRLLDALTPHRW